ncbi:MAG TPA: hypothetical protein VM118_10410, partial [Acidobacteriota bacterium]|nr:hypothetical protein [Acidobacteriota bacterium]
WDAVSTLDCFVGASEVWNADGSSLNVVDDLTVGPHLKIYAADGTIQGVDVPGSEQSMKFHSDVDTPGGGVAPAFQFQYSGVAGPTQLNHHTRWSSGELGAAGTTLMILNKDGELYFGPVADADPFAHTTSNMVWSGTHEFDSTVQFDGNVTFPDNTEAIWGTGTDLHIFHDETFNVIRSDIPDGSGEVGILTRWAIEADFGAQVLTTPPVLERWVHTNAASADVTVADMRANCRMEHTTANGPGFVLHRDTTAHSSTDRSWIGWVEIGNVDKFSGMELRASNIIAFMSGGVEAMATLNDGLQIKNTLETQSGENMKLEIRAQVGFDHQAMCRLFPRSAITVPLGYRLFSVEETSVSAPVFNVWANDTGDGGTNIRGFGTEPDYLVSFNDSAVSPSVQGDAYMTYVSADSMLDVRVAGNECMRFADGVVQAMNYAVSTKTGAYTLADDRVLLADTDGGAITITLPAASTAQRAYFVKNTGTSGNAVTVARTGGDTINEVAADATITDGNSAEFVSDGTSDWQVV